MTNVLLLLLGCSDFTTETLSESWQIDRLRILGVAAEPAEPRPGDTVRFRSLVVAPGEGVGAVIWLACVNGNDSTNGCAADTSIFSEVMADGAVSPEEQAALVEAGLIGVEPFLPPSWTIPADALDALPAEDRAEGFPAFVNITAVPGSPDPSLASEIDPDEVELAFKRLPISENPQPNQNPDLTHVEVDGVVVEDGGGIEVGPGDTVELLPVLGEGSVEDYPYVTSEGVVETRTESPWVEWYAEGGAYSQTTSLYPELARTWTAPSEPGVVSLWMVVRDRRGGMDWLTLVATVR
jgi:hypothetical protein